MHENLILLPEKSAKIISNTIQQRSKPEKAQDTVEIDEKDIKIADKLAQDGRAPIAEIAKEIGISNETVKKRYEKLCKKGVIKVTIQTDLTEIGYRAMAVFYVSTNLQENSFSIIDQISQIPDVISIMKNSGDYDLQVYAMIRDIDELIDIQENMCKIRGITKIDLEMTRCPNIWPTPGQYMSTF
jgi:Lrp/AsnC family transcriptional regulator for asnA, asnC and gidA